MKKGKIVGIIMIAACMLTGCIDNMPDMNAEQSELVAEYAAGVLLKYSPDYHYRLANEAELAQAQEEEMSTEEQTEEASEVEESIHVSASVEEEVSQTQTETEQNEVENGDEYNLAILFGLDDLTIRYQSFEVTDSYPKAEKGSGFSVTAPQGYNLMILHFDVENSSSQTVDCNLFDQVSKVRVNVNDSGYRDALSTLLTNDFTTYMEEIAAGETKDMIAAVAVKEADRESVNTVMMRIVNGENVTDISLE